MVDFIPGPPSGGGGGGAEGDGVSDMAFVSEQSGADSDTRFARALANADTVVYDESKDLDGDYNVEEKTIYFNQDYNGSTFNGTLELTNYCTVYGINLGFNGVIRCVNRSIVSGAYGFGKLEVMELHNMVHNSRIFEVVIDSGGYENIITNNYIKSSLTDNGSGTIVDNNQ